MIGGLWLRFCAWRTDRHVKATRRWSTRWVSAANRALGFVGGERWKS